MVSLRQLVLFLCSQDTTFISRRLLPGSKVITQSLSLLYQEIKNCLVSSSITTCMETLWAILQCTAEVKKSSTHQETITTPG